MAEEFTNIIKLFKNKYLCIVRSPEGAQRIPGNNTGHARSMGVKRELSHRNAEVGESETFPATIPEYVALLPGYGYLHRFSV
jgi:hypothetical protein